MNTPPPTLTLDEALPASPLKTFTEWMTHAWAHAGVDNPNAMALSTVQVLQNWAKPSTRIVLLKDFNADDGFAVFYTNYESRKGTELAQNAHASAVLHWDNLGLQVRFEGLIVKSPLEESDAYFNSRPRESRIGAWTSEQSRPLETRQDLLDQRNAMQQRFAECGENIPKPPHWGGYRLWLSAVELWCNGDFRLHDRARWTRDLNSDDLASQIVTPATAWTATRLQP